MLTFEEFQQATRLDFGEIADGDEFECLVQELFQALGFEAQRTGLGSDKGVDITAEEILIDKLGVQRRRRYIVQCKHFAASKRAVGTSDVTDVLDTVVRNRGNGYVLVTSSDVTTTVRMKLSELSDAHPELAIQVWDRIALEQQLNAYPVVVAKYFPNRFQQVKVSWPVPRDAKQSYVRDRIVAHIDQYVGTKFIPKLYVRRYIEESLKDELLSPVDSLKKLALTYSKEIREYVDKINQMMILPESLRASSDSTQIFSFDLDVKATVEGIRLAGEDLVAKKWEPVASYIKTGAAGLRSSVDTLSDHITKYIETVDRYLDPFSECATAFHKEEIRLGELVNDLMKEASAGNLRLEAESRAKGQIIYQKRNEQKRQLGNIASPIDHDRSKKYIDGEIAKYLETDAARKVVRKAGQKAISAFIQRQLETQFPWRQAKFLSRYHIRIEQGKQSNPETFSSLWERLSAIRRTLRTSPLFTVKEQLQSTVVPITAVIDIAGSGKTNLCCRLSLQLVNRGFVVFLTGKSLGREFSDIRTYLTKEITTALRVHTDTPLEDLCQTLQKKGYPLTIIFDGINENIHPSNMKLNLGSLIEFAKTSPVKVLITSRIEYWDYYSDIVAGDYINIISARLTKFTEDEHAIAIPVYLDHYRLDVRLENRAWEQLKRPLLLRFFCEAYSVPGKTSYRRLPPITDVRLFHLFGEYCKAKYGNIKSRLSENRYKAELSHVEDVALLLARTCLRNKSRALSSLSISKALSKLSPHAGEIYRMLLDEDIIIEETIEQKKNSLERQVSFVYEAFMEYLMAKVLIRQSSTDKTLFVKVRRLIQDEQVFVHARGIMSFLLPYCTIDRPKTYKLIASQFRRPEYGETCIPAILNLWDSDWETGIWPVFESACQNILAIPVDQLATFVKDWLTDHDAIGFVKTTKQNPKAIISILGDRAAQIVFDSNAAPDQILESLISLLESGVSQSVARDSLSLIRKFQWCARDTTVDGSPFYLRLINAAIPTIEKIRYEPKYSRNWTVLELLGELVERLDVQKNDLSETVIHRLRPLVETAAFDELCVRMKLKSSTRWWIKILGIDLAKVEAEAEEWLFEPYYVQRLYSIDSH
jgi:hypothetical protein